MSKDTKILDKKLNSTNIDLIFAKNMEKKVKKMDFSQFKKALIDMAAKKGIEPAALEAKIKAAGGPTYSGTAAEAVRLHDDTSTYTGVYAKGGPTNVDDVGWSAAKK